MSIRHYISNILSAAVIALTAILLPSCAEDRFAIPDYTVSGEPVTLSVPVKIPAMPVATRGDLSPNQLNRVETLWIRTYNAETLEATSEWLKLEPKTTDLHNMRDVTLNTKSGYSYIIAVANVEHLGISGKNLSDQKPLKDLLEAADTWDKFLQIAIVAPSDQDDVNAPQSNTLPMCGCYSDAIIEGPNTEPVSLDTWQEKNFQPYFIPASKDKVEFNGGIHLRRLVSHITFNFFEGEDINLTVNSYQVMNAPKFSWLYERNSKDFTIVNFGDQAKLDDNSKYFADVEQFGSQFTKDGTVDEKAAQSFDFWLAENKHTGTCTQYSNRDLKTIAPDGVTLFTSLTGETWTPNNEASYVIVNCDINYKSKIKVDEDGAKVENGTEVERSGHASYIIHLGYILGNTPEEKAKDFNCFRNVDYTYNVTVNGLDDIRVDATADIENFHGEEGLVVDLNANAFTLDGHYAVFNIQLTEDELKENFGFIITTYDNGEQITISEQNPREDINGTIVIYSDETKTKSIEPKYYNWIELRPTENESTLAEYRPRYGTNADGKTFLLSNLYNIKDQNNNNILNLPAACKSATGWYTVFVNEYTYEPIYTGFEGYANETTQPGERPTWMNYVNQNPRRFYIKVSYRESNDHNSVYARSKYAVQQQSLMTYYSQINRTQDGTAIAVERENETLGMNLRHIFWGGNSFSNGRWNTAQFIDYSKNGTTVTNPSMNGDVSRRPYWNKFLEMKNPLYVEEVPTDRLQGGPAIPSGNRPMRKLKILDDLTLEGNNPSNFTDPQPSNDYNIEYIATCLSRNRDNNGNGRIDPDELRWYVPAINNYIELTLGSNAMTQPLMEVESVSRLPYVNDTKNGFSDTPGQINNTFYSRYMFVASNVAPQIENTGKFHNNVLWAIEGSSLSAFRNLKEWTDDVVANRTDINPWQIRCIRNLGANLTNVQQEVKVTPPYVHDEGARKLTMSYFNLASIRTMQYLGNGKDNADYMPVHTINSPYNKPYAAFEYAAEDKLLAQHWDFNNGFDSVNPWFIDKINSNPCADLGSGWRVPNQIELTMMMNTGKILNGNAPDYNTWLSCTANYFNFTNGLGSNGLTNKFLLISFFDHTSQLASNNFGDGKRFYVRCVRDVQP